MIFDSAQIVDFLNLPKNFFQKNPPKYFRSIHSAKKDSLCFFQGEKLPASLLGKEWSLLLVPHHFSEENIRGPVYRCEDPYRLMISLMENFDVHPRSITQRKVSARSSIHPTAIVEGEVLEEVEIGPFCVVEKGCFVGRGTKIHGGVYLGKNVVLGAHCEIFSGVNIGYHGFGFFDEKPPRRIPHFGSVIIGDRVSIGANSVISAGLIEPTSIGNDTHIDALVMVGHNANIGEENFIAGQAGMAGSVTIGNGVRIAGGAQLAWHLCIGDGATITARAGVIGNVPAGETYSGFPARNHKEWLRSVAKVNRLK